MVKTKKGGKLMNPTDAYRKELRKKELKRNKKERKKVREVGILKKDPDQIKDQIQKLELMKADGALDKARKHKKRQLEDTLNLVLKKRKEYEEKLKEKGEAPVMFSHLGPPPRRRTTAEEEERVNHPRPEDSVYYHPTLNPTGAPPPGKPPMYKSSIGPRIPLSTDALDASSSGTAAPFLETETDDFASAVPPPPPPPPLPEASKSAAGDGHVNPVSLPLPPPPPMPPKATAPSNMGQLPHPILPPPPPPPGPPPMDQVAAHPPLPPPPPLPQAARHQPPGAGGSDVEKNQSASTDDLDSKVPNQVHMVLPPPPPPPPGLKSASDTSESAPSEAVNGASVTKDIPSMIPPPPPPRHPLPGPPPLPAIQPDVLPPGISRLPPPPPPPAMQASSSAPGIPGQVAPSGFMAPFIPRPPYGPPPGPPLMMRPPPPLGPPTLQEDASNRQYAPQKPSYVKSAAPTVVKRPLAQHTPELTSMVPASVRVKRETALPKPKPKPSLALTSSVANRQVAPTVIKSEPVSTSTVPKGQSIDDSYSAFLEDMKALGALDS